MDNSRRDYTTTALILALLVANVTSILMSSSANSTANSANRELLESERLNTSFHTKSIDDRKTIHDGQQANIQRIEALEKAVAELKRAKL